ncbi:MAG: polyprenyl diphosphate synthase [bacterium]
MLDKTKLPNHIAIIMDGNRRWAKKQGLNILKGHEYVVTKVVENLIERCGELGIKYLTMWVFSTENWGREKGEVDGLMRLFRKALMEQVESFIKKGARLKMIGEISKFPSDIQKGMKEAMNKSEKNDKITVTFALNYGGRDEIVRGINKLIQNSKSSDHSPIVAQGSELEQYLDTTGMPDPDLIIRTGGEKRLSGFMLWQAAYAELYFTETLMPEFGVKKLEEALEDYQKRQRRFGK